MKQLGLVVLPVIASVAVTLLGWALTESRWAILPGVLVLAAVNRITLPHVRELNRARWVSVRERQRVE